MKRNHTIRGWIVILSYYIKCSGIPVSSWVPTFISLWRIIWLVFAWPGTEGCIKMATSTEKYILHICKNLVNLYPLVLEKWYTKWIVYVWFMYAIDSTLLRLNLHLNLSVSTMTLWQQAIEVVKFLGSWYFLLLHSCLHSLISVMIWCDMTW